MNECWCCGRTDRKLERHHKIARRFYRPGENHTKGNLVGVCHECHKSLHKHHDNPKWSRMEYVIHMESIDYGRGLYKEAA